MSRAFLFLCLCQLCCTVDVLHCSAEGPKDCSFPYLNYNYYSYYNTWCSWNPDSGWSLYAINPGNYWSPGLADERSLGLLTSRNSCSTGGHTFCLTFLYYFSVSDLIDLSVYITNIDTGARQKTWSVFNSSLWDIAYVPISTDFDFVVQIEAIRRGGSSVGKVYIDDIIYFDLTSCTLSPSWAAVPATPATTLSTTKTTTSTITTAIRTTTKKPTTAISSASTTRNASLEIPGSTIKMRENDSSVNIGAVIGPIVAVIIIIAIVIILLIMYRKNKLQDVNICFKREKAEQNSRNGAVDNVAYDPHDIGLDESAFIAISGPNAATQSADYYNVVQGQPSAQESLAQDDYATVNKPQKPRKQPGQPEVGPYEIAGTPSVGIYHVPQTPAAGGKPKISDHNMKSFDDYSSLNYSAGETGAAYSHLHTGNEGGYNELNRDGKTRVIDEEYSHAQDQ